MKTEIIPLGTASAIPTRERHPSATALVREGRMLLFDCGEGTQLRLLHAGLKRTRLEAVFVSHLHGDHYFGLMGLLSTLSLLDREEILTVVGPAGIGEIIRGIPGLEEGWLTYPVVFVELFDDFTKDVVYDTDEFFVEARPIQHRVFAAGYRYEEKPRPGKLDVEKARRLGVSDYLHYRRLKEGEAVLLPDGRRIEPETVVGPERQGASFAYVSDTRPCETGRVLARQASLLYHEATFTSDEARNAVETGHSTAREAAEIARDAGSRRLLLGHFSARYTDLAQLEAEAREVFQNTEVAEELKRYVL